MKQLTIDNSRKNAIENGKWKNPGAKLYDQLLDSFYCKGDIPTDSDELDKAIKNGEYLQWDSFIKEAYMVAPIKDIKNSPYGKTPFSRSGCKYPHHIIKGDKLVISLPGLRSAYICARNQGIISNTNHPEHNSFITHFNRHCKELGLKPFWHHGEFYLESEEFISDQYIMESNFNDIFGYILEDTGINLFLDTECATEDMLHLESIDDITDDQLLQYLDEEFNTFLSELNDNIYFLEDAKIYSRDLTKSKESFKKRWKYNDSKKMIYFEDKDFKIDINTDIETYKWKYKLFGKENENSEQKFLCAVYNTSDGPTIVMNKEFWKYPEDMQDAIILHEVGHIVCQMTPKPFPKSIKELIQRIKKTIQRLVARIRMRKYVKGIHGDGYNEIEADIWAAKRCSPEVMKKMIKTGNVNDIISRRSELVEEMKKVNPKNKFRQMYDKNENAKAKWSFDEYYDRIIEANVNKIIANLINNPMKNEDISKRISALDDQKLYNSKYFKNESTGSFSINRNDTYNDLDSAIAEAFDKLDEFIYESNQESETTVSNYNEDRYFKILKSDISEDFKPKQHRSLSEFTRKYITAELARKYKDKGKLIGMMRDQDPEYNDDCFIWIDKDDDYVCAITYDTKDNENGHRYISGIDVAYKYLGCGLGVEMLEFAIKHGVDALNVQYDNAIALKMYLDHGFEISEESKKEVKERKSNTYEMFLNNGLSNHSEFLSNISTPEDLLLWMDKISYGWISSKDRKTYGTDKDDDETDFFKYYYLQSPNQLSETKVGVCWDQVELERKWFESNSYNFATIYIEINDGANCPTHTFLIYETENGYNWFEHSWYDNKGIHEYKTIRSLFEDIISKHRESNNDDSSPLIVTNYQKPKYGISCDEFMNFCRSSKRVDLGDISNEIFNESYNMNNLPNILYFASPTKLNGKTISAKMPRGLFLSPYIGIASIFTIDRFKIAREYFNNILAKNNKEIYKCNYNIEYKEWELDDEKLMNPLPMVHLYHNIPNFREIGSGSTTGYIYSVDISSIKNDLETYVTNDANREVIYRGSAKLPIKGVLEHHINYEITYRKQNTIGKIEIRDMKTIKESTSDENVYRISSNGIGIYEVLRQRMTSKQWQDFIKSENCTWLPKPDKYLDGYKSYFTKAGIDKYNELVAPIVDKVIGNNINIETYRMNEIGDIVYQDEYQLIASSMESFTESGYGNVRRYLYNEFINYAKSIKKKNTFGTIYDDDTFTKVYPFVPYEMQFFYRVSNPILCVLEDDLCFFQLSELEKLNKDGNNSKMKDMIIFAASLSNMKVFNFEDRKIYNAIEENGSLVLKEIISDGFDKYIQQLIGRNDIL